MRRIAIDLGCLGDLGRRHSPSILGFLVGRFRSGLSIGRLDRNQRVAFRYTIADFHVNCDDRACSLGWHVHCRLVRLQRDQRVFHGDHIARRCDDLDDFNIGKITEVRDR